MIFGHDGDYGDTIAAMALMREMGGGDLILYPTQTRHPYTPEHVAGIAPLLEKQHYVSSVKFATSCPTDGINLGAWRFNYKNGHNLADIYFSWIHKPHIDRDQPWLWCYEPNHVADVVFCRSARYHGNFPWKRANKKYKKYSVFIGTEQEHRDFEDEFGEIPYHPTKDLWEAARIIAAAKLVLVNQTSLFWIAEALKRPLCLEASGKPHDNCHWDRTGSIYGTSQLMELPDHDILDERLAYVCSERDCGRSLLANKRLDLARLALECSRLPGDAIELGVYRGGSAAIIAAAMPGKVLHLFDTFEGIPQDDPGGHHKGDFATDLEDVKNFLRGYNVKFHVGFFPDTTHDMADDVKFSFAHVDLDTYQSTSDALDYLLPRMVKGGVLVMDDLDWPHCPGVRRAIEERGLQVEKREYQGIIRV